MSVFTIEQMGPFLVSDLPPVGAVPSPAARFRAGLTRRFQERAFERALRTAGHGEYGDLLAMARRD